MPKLHLNSEKKFIATLHDEQGTEHTKHNAKAVMLERAFKDRLGTSTITENGLNLTSLITIVDDLSHLKVPFTKKEIDQVVKDIPSDKAPGQTVPI